MDEDEESSILIPIINDELTVMSFVVPKNLYAGLFNLNK